MALGLARCSPSECMRMLLDCILALPSDAAPALPLPFRSGRLLGLPILAALARERDRDTWPKTLCRDNSAVSFFPFKTYVNVFPPWAPGSVNPVALPEKKYGRDQELRNEVRDCRLSALDHGTCASRCACSSRRCRQLRVPPESPLIVVWVRLSAAGWPLIADARARARKDHRDAERARGRRDRELGRRRLRRPAPAQLG